MVMAMFQFQEFRSTLFLLIWVDQAYCEEFLKVLVFRATPKATSMHHIHACMQQLRYIAKSVLTCTTYSWDGVYIYVYIYYRAEASMQCNILVKIQQRVQCSTILVLLCFLSGVYSDAVCYPTY